MNGTDELIARIESAFAEVPYPGDDRLTDSSYGEEPAALVEDFRGRTDWRALDPGFLDAAPQGWSTALSFFSGPALHFFLPAYLIADLRGQLVHGNEPSFRLCWGVSPAPARKRVAQARGGGTIGEWARGDFAAFDRAQVDVIVDYLLWKLDDQGYDPTVEQALEHYWLERQAELAAAARTD